MNNPYLTENIVRPDLFLTDEQILHLYKIPSDVREVRFMTHSSNIVDFVTGLRWEETTTLHLFCNLARMRKQNWYIQILELLK